MYAEVEAGVLVKSFQTALQKLYVKGRFVD
jgi:hypothetical protein